MMWIKKSGLGLLVVLCSRVTARSASMNRDLMLLYHELTFFFSVKILYYIHSYLRAQFFS